MPKCLVSIGGKPLLQYWLESLTRAGVEKIHINTHYLADQVETFIAESGFKHCVQLHHEDQLLGTGGSIKKMLDAVLAPTVLVAHADNYFEFDWRNLFRAHENRPAPSEMTLLLFETETPRECGIVELEDDVVVAFHEKVEQPPSNLASTATFLISRDQLMARLRAFPDVFDFSKTLLPSMLGEIFTIKTTGYWCDIGNLDAYQRTNDRVTSLHSRSKI